LRPASDGEALGYFEGAISWWIGDWWAYGEHSYGARSAVIGRICIS